MSELCMGPTEEKSTRAYMGLRPKAWLSLLTIHTAFESKPHLSCQGHTKAGQKGQKAAVTAAGVSQRKRQGEAK